MITKKIPGIVLAVVVMLTAKLLSAYIPTMGATLLSLLLGIIIRQIIINFNAFTPGIVWSEKYILEAAIVFIGFGFEISKFSKIGGYTVLIIFISIIMVMLATLFLSKIFDKKNSKVYWLLGAGSAICGSSAIGATAPLIEAKGEETGLSLAVVNLLGLLGMILLPIIATALHYTNVDTGILIGGILQSVGHVVSAGFSINEEIGQYATVVKMCRVAFLVPFLLFIYFLFRKKNSSGNIKFPLFIVFFLLAVIISQTGILGTNTLKHITKFGDTLLNIGMAAIGLKINIRTLWKISGKVFLVGSIIFIIQIIMYLIFLLY